MTTINEAIKKHVKSDKIRQRIGYSFFRRGVDNLPIEEFEKKYPYSTILTFPYIGKIIAQEIVDAIEKEKQEQIQVKT